MPSQNAAKHRVVFAWQWHLGINHDSQDRRFTPVAHGYQSYLGAPWTNAPMCAMDSDGFSRKFAVGPSCAYAGLDPLVLIHSS